MLEKTLPGTVTNLNALDGYFNLNDVRAKFLDRSTNLNDEFHGTDLFREFEWLPYQSEWQIYEIDRENLYNNNNNNHNKRFLYSAFPNYDQSASQCIITPVIGFRHNSALRVHFLHSLGSIPASRRFTGAHNANSTTIPFASYRVPILTPGSRAAMWIKCLAEGQNYRATVGFEPGLSAWESSGHTTIPRHPNGCHDIFIYIFFLISQPFLNRMFSNQLYLLLMIIIMHQFLWLFPSKNAKIILLLKGIV